MNQIVARRPPIDKLAELGLTDDRQRRVQELINNTHTGRWPLWRGYAMHCRGARVYELVEWVPRRQSIEARRFNVVTWSVSLTSVGTTWQRQHMTRRAAAALFATMKRGNRASVGEVGVMIAG